MIEKDKREENTKKKTRECGDRYKIIYVGNLSNRWAGFDRVRDQTGWFDIAMILVST